MSDVAEVLTKARELIADPEHWTQGHYAVDADGRPAFGDKACAWCAEGALWHTTGDSTDDDSFSAAFGVLKECALTLSPVAGTSGAFSPVVRVNDTLGHDATLRMFDCAIAKASA